MKFLYSDLKNFKGSDFNHEINWTPEQEKFVDKVLNELELFQQKDSKTGKTGDKYNFLIKNIKNSFFVLKKMENEKLTKTKDYKNLSIAQGKLFSKIDSIPKSTSNNPNLNSDTILEVLKHSNLETISNLCKSNKEYMTMCSNYKNSIAYNYFKNNGINFKPENSGKILSQVLNLANILKVQPDSLMEEYKLITEFKKISVTILEKVFKVGLEKFFKIYLKFAENNRQDNEYINETRSEYSFKNLLRLLQILDAKNVSIDLTNLTKFNDPLNKDYYDIMEIIHIKIDNDKFIMKFDNLYFIELINKGKMEILTILQTLSNEEGLSQLVLPKTVKSFTTNSMDDFPFKSAGKLTELNLINPAHYKLNKNNWYKFLEDSNLQNKKALSIQVSKLDESDNLGNNNDNDDDNNDSDNEDFDDSDNDNDNAKSTRTEFEW